MKELERLLSITPKGVIDMLSVKGIGGKKVRTIWKELGIETLSELKIACIEGKISNLKGFGESLQQEILEFIEFKELSKGKYYFADVESLAQDIESKLKNMVGENVAITGDIKLQNQIVSSLAFVVKDITSQSLITLLQNEQWLIIDPISSSPFVVRGVLTGIDLKIEFYISNKSRFGSDIYLTSAAALHLANKVDSIAEKNIYLHLKKKDYETLTEANLALGFDNLPDECKEGIFEFEANKNVILKELISEQDLKGIFHNHTTYSDGQNTLLEMATYCKELGYQYLGISDHSKTANYAQGLFENKVAEQHAEIEKLNQQLYPFKIYKGIESDILADGSLDYEPGVLASFDFIIASIHANLNMDIEKATTRLIKAIENPYTTMLGHPTGRLLLRRKGYPIDHRKVIDACAANGVIIEINANPWRLDIDYTWIPYCLEKGVIISINPDAHELEGYHDMRYGTIVARKGGLPKSACFNAWDIDKVENYLQTRKTNIITHV
jgi:DNA polymerase (family 10)